VKTFKRSAGATRKSFVEIRT